MKIDLTSMLSGVYGLSPSNLQISRYFTVLRNTTNILHHPSCSLRPTIYQTWNLGNRLPFIIGLDNYCAITILRGSSTQENRQ